MLLFHYHIFKNAGTSVDAMLKANFGEAWAESEFRPPPPGKNTNVEEVAFYLSERPQLRAFSSHTAQFPLPEIGRPVFPILFLRHPIDRIKSAYAFERKQVADTYGARLAKEHDFAGYVQHLLDLPAHRQTRNFQTSRLASNEPATNGSELERAMRALDAMPFVGLVEEYEKSLERLRRRLVEALPGFKILVVHANKTQEAPEPMEERLKAIERAMGEELYARLVAANADDFAIFERVRTGYVEQPAQESASSSS
jgi:hypothetical protein